MLNWASLFFATVCLLYVLGGIFPSAVQVITIIAGIFSVLCLVSLVLGLIQLLRR